MLSKCNNADSSLDRLISVVAWSISTVRPLMFGVAPYNHILGETHHVSRGTVNVLLDQVSHHPPINALHATDEKENIQIIWCPHAVPKFYGTTVETEVHGKRQLKLLNHGELMNSPKLWLRFLPVPGVEWVGNVRIQCPETGLEADLCYKSNSSLGLGGNYRAIKGKIYEASSLKTFYEIDGYLRIYQKYIKSFFLTVTIKDTNNGKVTIIFNAKVISGLTTPTIKLNYMCTALDSLHQGVWPSESVALWSEGSQAILSKDWEKATKAKKGLEEMQRQLLRDRKSRGETRHPKHFSLTNSKEDGWDCSSVQKWVPPAPVIVPIKLMLSSSAKLAVYMQ
ncbi:LOW QUALITY PROTEIN: Oxysterol_BP domain-containing protein [Cephalotus follicularis]|uniref:Oxysterol_BP domain-containing protein n=1 Tax=Cephalotus follicularis TaxID=3775 RepID=A0A1Q3B547_CEPFO|nr:LOW QUALITY PROTEIN: Oxysterol_BP domain-containing protein [Cephalotus follicularis]